MKMKMKRKNLVKIPKLARKSKPNYSGMHIRDLKPEIIDLKRQIIELVCSYEDKKENIIFSIKENQEKRIKIIRNLQRMSEIFDIVYNRALD